MFTLAISCLTTSNLPCFMDLTFQVPMEYCSFQHWTLLLSPITSTAGYYVFFGSILSLISSSILGTYRPGEFLFQYPIICLSYCSWGSQGRILKWLAIPFSSGSHSVRPLHHDLPVLGGPTGHGLVSLS